MRRSPFGGASVAVLVLVYLATACGGGDSPTTPHVEAPLPAITYPAFSVTGPARAAMLEQGGAGADNVAVSGTVCDTESPITSLSINGAPVTMATPALCQPFTVNAGSAPGLTIITGEARNQAGRTSYLAQSFLRSSQYYQRSETPAPGAKVGYGLVANILGNALDDNNLSTDDIGAILSNAANSLVNWNSVFPTIATPDANNDDLVDSWSYDCPFGATQVNHKTGFKVVRSGNFTHGTLTIDVAASTTVPNRVTITTTVPNAVLPVRATGYLDLGCVGELTPVGDGTVHATSIVVTITEDVHNDSASVFSIGISAPGLVVDVDFTAFNIINNLIGSATTAAASLMTSSLVGGYIADMSTPTLANLLYGFFPPAALGALGNLVLSSEAESGTPPSGYDGLMLGQKVQTVPSAPKPGFTPEKGSIKPGTPAPPKFGTGPKKPIGIGVKDDLINQFFWGAWRSGFFDLGSLTSFSCDGAVPGGAVTFAATALLPPVLMPATGDSVSIGLGDLRLTGSVARSVVGGTGAPLDVTLYGSVIATGTVGLTSSGLLTLAFSPTPRVEIQITSISDSSQLTAVRTTLAPYVGCVARKAAQNLLEGFPRPELSVPKLGAGTKWGVKNPIVGREPGYTTIKGDVEVR